MRQPSEKLTERLRAVGDLVQRARVQKAMSQAALGKALGLSRKTVGLIEQGRRPLDQWEMDVLARVLDIREASFYDPPRRSRLVSEPLDAYLSDYVGEVAAEAAASVQQPPEPRKP